jgi:DNA-binding CsgD family transcriptional regulator
MMLAGADTGGIALALAISVETLRTHVKHAYRKLGVSSRGQLFAGALDFIHP